MLKPVSPEVDPYVLDTRLIGDMRMQLIKQGVKLSQLRAMADLLDAKVQLARRDALLKNKKHPEKAQRLEHQATLWLNVVRQMRQILEAGKVKS